VRRRGSGGTWAGLLPLSLLAVVGVTGCSAGHSAAGAAASGGRTGPSAAGGTTADSSAGNSRVNAIEKIITRTSNSDDSFVQFNDVSDLSKDQLNRLVQLSCDTRGCVVVVGCDSTGEPACAGIAPKLTPMGFFRKQQTYTLGIRGSDNGHETVDVSPGSAHDFAVLTEKIFLDVLGASRDFKLTWQSAAQQTPVPVPVD
jgi:hypothetical protein